VSQRGLLLKNSLSIVFILGILLEPPTKTI
jgi:hypothetical protein